MKDESIEGILREMREEDIRLSSEDTPKSEKRALRFACAWCAEYADRIEAALQREHEEIETTNEYTVDDVRICFLQDADLARDKAEEKYPEAVISDKYAIPLEVAKIARGIATNIHVRLDAGDRGILLLASYYAAKYDGWEEKHGKEERND